MKQVATQAGVSISTVSAALCRTGRVGRAERERIGKIASDMGYRPKIAAQLMRAERTGRLGLLVESNDASGIASAGLFGPIMSEFNHSCARIGAGCHVECVMPATPDVTAESYAGPDCFAGGLVDGALVVGYIGSPLIRQWLESNWDWYPWVSLDEPSRLSVCYDHAGAIHTATQYLTAKGHRRIAYMGSVSPFRVHSEGFKGFKRAAADFGVSVSDAKVHLTKLNGVNPDRRETMRDQVAGARRFVSHKDRPTAIIAQGVPDARAAVYAAMEAGLSVPRDLSIITVGTAADAEKAPPCLHCVEPNAHVMVAEGLALLRGSLAGEKLANPNVVVATKLVERDSVALI